MSDIQLDSIDMKILDELSRNARLPTATLARRVNLSRNGVRQRIERLERDQVIAGYTIVAGSGRRNPVNALMMIYRRDRMRGAEVGAAIQKIPELVFCYVVSGEADIILQVKARHRSGWRRSGRKCRSCRAWSTPRPSSWLAPVVEPGRAQGGLGLRLPVQNDLAARTRAYGLKARLELGNREMMGDDGR